ncbi:hypothetical protein ACFXB3_07270 [Streptomyces sp. NPDC059447]|uniref:hypothetical protein n=1 Tax=Streptomyces sp. NPDC059447 TaxID=3346834 RepID=UPI0036C988C7
MPKTTEHHFTIVVSGPGGGKVVTRSGTLNLEPTVTRPAVRDYLLRELAAKYGPGLKLVSLDLSPDLR